VSLSTCWQHARDRVVRSILLLCLLAAVGLAQENAKVAGDYGGTLGPLHIKLHLVAAADGTITGTVDSPDQGLYALACSDIRVNGPALSFTVPNVRGEWTGLISADGMNLTGVWRQGNPVQLNLTRISGAESGNGTTPSAPQAPAGPAAPTTMAAVPKTSCTSTFGVAYWDGSAWKPMVLAAHLGKDTGVSLRQGIKNPFNPRAGYTSIVTFKNPEANLTLEGSPRFCVPIPANYDPTIVKIGVIDVKKDHRELETCTGPCASRGRSQDDWMPDKRVQAVDVKRISDTLVEITPKTPLQPGQYILGGPPLVGYYDFGVKAGGSGQ